MMRGFEKHFRIKNSDIKTWRFGDDMSPLSNVNYNKIVNVIYTIVSDKLHRNKRGVKSVKNGINKTDNHLNTSVYRKKTNKGLLLHYQSHVDNRYKRSLIRTMLDRAKRLSSSPDLFSKECYDLRKMFLTSKYPVKLIDSIFKRFHASQDQNQSCIEPIDNHVLITLPFKDQKSADSVRKQLNDLGKKIDRVIQPVFTSKKISEDLKVTETKPSLVNQPYVVYEYQCNSCDSNYIGYTSRHLHLRIEEHKYSVIGKHLKDKHNQRRTNLHEHFTILKKWHGDALIRKKRPTQHL